MLLLRPVDIAMHTVTDVQQVVTAHSHAHRGEAEGVPAVMFVCSGVLGIPAPFQRVVATLSQMMPSFDSVIPRVP